MLVIRLKPIGKKHQISYRVVVVERRSKLNGRFVEDLGFYNPQTKEYKLKADRIKYWMSNGAQLSDTVHNLAVKDGVVDGPKKVVKMKPSKKAKEEKTEETSPEGKPVPSEVEGKKPDESSTGEESSEKAEESAPAETPAEGTKPAETSESKEAPAEEKQPADAKAMAGEEESSETEPVPSEVKEEPAPEPPKEEEK